MQARKLLGSERRCLRHCVEAFGQIASGSFPEILQKCHTDLGIRSLWYRLGSLKLPAAVSLPSFSRPQLINRGEILSVNLHLSPVATNLPERKLRASAAANNRLDKPSGGPQIALLIAGIWKVLRLLSAPGEPYARGYSIVFKVGWRRGSLLSFSTLLRQRVVGWTTALCKTATLLIQPQTRHHCQAVSSLCHFDKRVSMLFHSPRIVTLCLCINSVTDTDSPVFPRP